MTYLEDEVIKDDNGNCFQAFLEMMDVLELMEGQDQRENQVLRVSLVLQSQVPVAHLVLMD